MLSHCSSMPRKRHFQHRKADKRREREKTCQTKQINSTEVQFPNKCWRCLKTQIKTVYCKWDSINEAAVEPNKVLHNVTVMKDGTWTVHVYGKEVDRPEKPTKNLIQVIPARI